MKKWLLAMAMAMASLGVQAQGAPEYMTNDPQYQVCQTRNSNTMYCSAGTSLGTGRITSELVFSVLTAGGCTLVDHGVYMCRKDLSSFARQWGGPTTVFVWGSAQGYVAYIYLAVLN